MDILLNKDTALPNAKNLIKENLPFVLFIVLMFSFRSSVADWYHVPSGSMEPTIQAGDRIVVDKTAYTLELPFSDIVIANTGDVERGDIVIINSSAAQNRLVKRAVAVAGDTAELRHNRLFINGESATITPLTAPFYEELLLGDSRTIALTNSDYIDSSGVAHRSIENPASSFHKVTIPKGYILAMGDNRDNSMDSRYYGLFPISEIQGRATSVAFSLDKSNYYLPRQDRALLTLN
jgi:signal peptidase I